MLASDLAAETFSALSANKVRSGLTILGIVIGIGAVIAMVSIGAGAAGSIRSSIEGLGTNLLTVTPGAAQGGRGFVSTGRGGAQTLKLSDADAIASLDGIRAVSPESTQRSQVVAQNGNNTNTTVIGAAPAYAEVRNVAVADGTFVTDGHYSGRSRVAVLGSAAAADLFGEEAATGKTIRLNGAQFKVIGVLAEKGSAGFFNPDDAIIVPLSTMQALLSRAEFVSTIAVSVDDPSRMDSSKEAITALLLDRHRVSEADFSVTSQSDIVGALTQVTSSFTTFLASVAGISLLVGGIGIMNMMLTTVTERTREIGLRKAIGARKDEIGSQFLSEAVLLTCVGGVLGVAFGWAVSLGVSRFAGIATTVTADSVFLAVGVAAGIGIAFGYYPARRAAAMNPIQALRYE